MVRRLKRKQYIWLLPLAAMVLFYQLVYSYEVYKVRNSSSSLDLPVYTTDGRISALTERAEKAGLRMGDKIVAIDGSPIQGTRDFYAALHSETSKEPLAITLKRGADARDRTVKIPGFARKPESIQLVDALIGGSVTAVMLFCVLIGIYVAVVLPSDVRALAFFGLMIGAAQVVSSAQAYDFPQKLWLFAQIYHAEAFILWPLWMICFALYFPAQFGWQMKRPWLKWILFAPFLLQAFFVLLIMAWRFYNFNLPGLLRSVPFSILGNGWWTAAGALFFLVTIGIRLGTTENRDARRRLRILFAGCATSLIPLGLLIAYQAFFGQDVLHPSSETILLPVCFLFCLFPVTFAYVVVAERAMDLRVAIRQGLRYTLAKAGMRVLVGIVVGAAIFGLSRVIFPSATNGSGSQRLGNLSPALAIAGILAWVTVTRVTRNRLTVWIDKRFFREAYNAQLVLEDLSLSVRSILDERQMMETVARRISETLHIPQFVFLLQSELGFRPEYCLGIAPPSSTSLREDSKAVRTVATSKEIPPIYFDREDNWIYSTSEEEVITLKALQTQILLPLSSRRTLIGLMSLGQKQSEEPYSNSDLHLLNSVATQTGMALENSRLTQVVANEIAQREKLNREVEIAREVQERLFPQQLPPIAGVEYSGACRPALGVGGDYYDFLALADGGLGVAIGDVSGKGIAAALLMASLQASLRGQALVGQGDLAKLMANVNQLVYGATPINRYATFFYGQLNTSTGLFRYVNAGHNPPVILRRGPDGVRNGIRLETGGPVVGLFPGAPYEEGAIQMEAGDIFVGFTDGISEAMNPADEEWGEERLIPAAAAHAASGASKIISTLMAEADEFASGAPQHDDMTLVVVKIDHAGWSALNGQQGSVERESTAGDRDRPLSMPR